MNMEREKIFCAAPWYYSMTKKSAITVRYIIEMKDEVDGDALRKALDVTMTRYPYLMKKLIVTPEEYLLEPNPLPIVLLHTDKPINLGGKEANWHQFALSYFEKSIYFNNTHAIFDGRGRSALLHTLMYYYCTYRYGEEQQMEGVNLAGTPIDPMEYDDPYVRELPKTAFNFDSIRKPHSVLRLDRMGLVTVGTPQAHRISISESALMNLCKNNDGTPNTAIALIMSRAIRKIHPDTGTSIVSGVYCDLRNALKSPLTHNSLVTTLDLAYHKELEDLDFADQNAIFRGRMKIQSDPAALLPLQEAQKSMCKTLSEMPTLEEKCKAASDGMTGLFRAHTFLVSYSGRSNFGSCDKYIKATFPQPYGREIGILMEITSVDGNFYIDFIQEWREDVYFNAFIKELRSLGVDCDLLYSGRNDPARFVFE